MRTITHTIYNFSELTAEAKLKAIDNYRDGQDFPWLESDMQEHLHELLAKHGIKSDNATVRYSLGYSQGDGASFTGDIEWKAWRAEIVTNQWGTHYMHNKSVSVGEMTSRKTDREAPRHKIDELQAIIESIGDELARHGYAIIESESSDESIAELLSDEANEFYADGKVA